MDSPPKLQRLMVPLPLMKNGFQDFEGVMVDSAVSDIPDVFKEVYKAQKCHADEMSKRKQALKILQEKLDQVEEKKEEMEEEIACVTNRVLLAKENIKEKNKAVKEVDKALKKLVVEIVDKKTENELLEQDIQIEIRNHESKKMKVQQFVAEVEAFESNSTVGQQIEAVKEKVSLLQQQENLINKDLEGRESMLSGKTKAILTSDIEEVKHRLTEALQERANVETEIEQEKEKQSKIIQNTQVLEKKNAAQITRQKRQLKEIQLRNRQRHLQVTQLETNIHQASKILDQ